MQRNDALRQLVGAFGVVEDRKDPLKLGRVRVRWFGFDNDNKADIPTEALPWAMILTSQDSDGHVTGYKEGDWVFGLFADGPLRQKPLVLGKINNIPEDIANPEIGFNDPTPDEELTLDKQPRPPFIGDALDNDLDDDSDNEEIEPSLPEDKLPATGTVFGVLKKDFKESEYPFDVNRDGVYDWRDADILYQNLLSRFRITDDGLEFSEPGGETFRYPMSRYPLEPLLKYPSTNAFELGADEAEVHPQYLAMQELKGELVVGGCAEHESASIGTDEGASGEPVAEIESQFEPVYPFNKARYTESGHLMAFDDTPGAERIEIAHRSGTFFEMHPDGVQVSKTQKNRYEIVMDHFLVYSGKDTQVSAKGNVGILSGGFLNLEAEGNINQDAEKLNSNIKLDINTKVGRDVYIKTEGDIVQLWIENEVQIICKDVVHFICEEDLLINGEKNIKIKADDVLHLEGKTNVAIISDNLVSTQTDITSLGGEVVGNIKANVAESLGVGPSGAISPVIVSKNAEFDDGNFIQEEAPSTSTIEPGYILDGAKFGDLWKPISDTKPFAVSLSLRSEQHELYEAVPTGELEEATIQYLNADLSITSWDVIRPIHKRGRLIERGRFNGIANGGRYHWVWSKMGKDFEHKHMILKIGPVEWIIYDPAVRHD